jgi:hypothetical protein
MDKVTHEVSFGIDNGLNAWGDYDTLGVCFRQDGESIRHRENYLRHSRSDQKRSLTLEEFKECCVSKFFQESVERSG